MRINAPKKIWAVLNDILDRQGTNVCNIDARMWSSAASSCCSCDESSADREEVNETRHEYCGSSISSVDQFADSLDNYRRELIQHEELHGCVVLENKESDDTMDSDIDDSVIMLDDDIEEEWIGTEYDSEYGTDQGKEASQDNKFKDPFGIQVWEMMDSRSACHRVDKTCVHRRPIAPLSAATSKEKVATFKTSNPSNTEATVENMGAKGISNHRADKEKEGERFETVRRISLDLDRWETKVQNEPKERTNRIPNHGEEGKEGGLSEKVSGVSFDLDKWETVAVQNDGEECTSHAYNHGDEGKEKGELSEAVSGISFDLERWETEVQNHPYQHGNPHSCHQGDEGKNDERFETVSSWGKIFRNDPHIQNVIQDFSHCLEELAEGVTPVIMTKESKKRESSIVDVSIMNNVSSIQGTVSGITMEEELPNVSDASIIWALQTKTAQQHQHPTCNNRKRGFWNKIVRRRLSMAETTSTMESPSSDSPITENDDCRPTSPIIDKHHIKGKGKGKRLSTILYKSQSYIRRRHDRPFHQI
eukprot:scaffold2598_cov136-Cylindrotheca_fusiformis.AAC.3